MTNSALDCLEFKISLITNSLHTMYPKHMQDTQLIEELQHELKQYIKAHAVVKRMQLKDNKPWKPPVP